MMGTPLNFYYWVLYAKGKKPVEPWLIRNSKFEIRNYGLMNEKL